MCDKVCRVIHEESICLSRVFEQGQCFDLPTARAGFSQPVCEATLEKTHYKMCVFIVRCGMGGTEYFGKWPFSERKGGRHAAQKHAN